MHLRGEKRYEKVAGTHPYHPMSAGGGGLWKGSVSAPLPSRGRGRERDGGGTSVSLIHPVELRDWKMIERSTAPALALGTTQLSANKHHTQAVTNQASIRKGTKRMTEAHDDLAIVCARAVMNLMSKVHYEPYDPEP